MLLLVSLNIFVEICLSLMTHIYCGDVVAVFRSFHHGSYRGAFV